MATQHCVSNNNNNNSVEEKFNGCSNGALAAANGNSVHKSAPSAEDPCQLIPELCRHFYHLGWASGTGGGLSIRQNGKIYCAPSGVQKERIQAQDMFVLDERTCEVLKGPQDMRLKCSECLPLFYIAFSIRDARCCIHSHSINANLVTELHSQQNSLSGDYRSLCSTEFRITNQEMIKGIKVGSTGKSLNYNDILVVPIIDNVLRERDLEFAMRQAVCAYPDSNAVLVRNHGVYVWGNSWQEAKSQAECYDYLFKLKLKAARQGFSWMLNA